MASAPHCALLRSDIPPWLWLSSRKPREQCGHDLTELSLLTSSARGFAVLTMAFAGRGNALLLTETPPSQCSVQFVVSRLSSMEIQGAWASEQEATKGKDRGNKPECWLASLQDPKVLCSMPSILIYMERTQTVPRLNLNYTHLIGGTETQSTTADRSILIANCHDCPPITKIAKQLCRDLISAGIRPVNSWLVGWLVVKNCTLNQRPYLGMGYFC